MYENFKQQNFQELKLKCLSSRKLFIDDKFVTSQASAKNYKWLRPHEISQNPKFFVDGFSRFDTNQGELGDCWFIAAMANLTQHQKLFMRVVPEDNGDFDSAHYSGIFHFRFWHNGKWIDIVIDDYLPTRRGELVFVQSTEKNEFWSALLEKAYAKLHGSYESLEGGYSVDAFANFTGGVTESYQLRKPHPDLYSRMLKSYNRKALMYCGLIDKSKKNYGLIGRHAYSITNIVSVVNHSNDVVQLLRIRNPHGNESEWRGDWSDECPNWKSISRAEIRRIKFEEKDDGEFYMEFDDFVRHFQLLGICYLTPDLMNANYRHDREWNMMSFTGSYSNSSSFNKSHSFELVDPDDEDDEDFCTVLISLLHLQNYRHDKKKIGFNLQNSEGIFIKKEMPANYLRETIFRYNLAPGKYTIHITSFDRNFDYMIRIFYEVLRSQPALKNNNRALQSTDILDVDDLTVRYGGELEGVTICNGQSQENSRPKKKKTIRMMGDIVNYILFFIFCAVAYAVLWFFIIQGFENVIEYLKKRF